MSDEPVVDADPVEDTGEPTAPESAPPEGTRAEQPTDDWGDPEKARKRYTDLQSAYTKTSQEAAELREWRQGQEAEKAHVDALNNPDTQDAAVQSLVNQLGEDGAREWLEARGFELEEDEEDDEPREFRDPRVDQILAEREESELNGRVQEVETQLNSRLDELAKEKNVNVDVTVGEGDDQYTLRDVILDAAAVHAGPDSPPNVERAFNVVLGFQDAVVKGYRSTKRGGPTPPPKGGNGEPASPLGDKNARLALANQIAEEAAQSS